MGLYVQRWEFNVRRELPWRVVVSAGYNGDYQGNLSTSKNLGALPTKYLSTSPVRDQATVNYLTTNVPNPFKGLLRATSLGTNTTTSRQQLLLPYPQFTGVNFDTQQGYGWYQARLAATDRIFEIGALGTGAVRVGKPIERDARKCA